MDLSFKIPKVTLGKEPKFSRGYLQNPSIVSFFLGSSIFFRFLKIKSVVFEQPFLKIWIFWLHIWIHWVDRLLCEMSRLHLTNCWYERKYRFLDSDKTAVEQVAIKVKPTICQIYYEISYWKTVETWKEKR